MTAKVFDGRAKADEVLEKVKRLIDDVDDAEGIRTGWYADPPCLAIVVAGHDDASEVYIRNKIAACRKVGIKPITIRLDDQCTTEDVIRVVSDLNCNNFVDALIVQLPLPPQVNTRAVIEKIRPEKDADGFAVENQGGVYAGSDVGVVPCTALGVMDALTDPDAFGEEKLTGKRAVVVGRSTIVGRPVAMLLLQDDATVTIAHSQTENLAEITREADILVVAIGKPKFITADMVKEGAVVIDVGINRDENGKLCGDVDFESVKEKASFITPVPRGIGPLTVANLMFNTYFLWAQKYNDKNDD